MSRTSARNHGVVLVVLTGALAGTTALAAWTLDAAQTIEAEQIRAQSIARVVRAVRVRAAASSSEVAGEHAGAPALPATLSGALAAARSSQDVRSLAAWARSAPDARVRNAALARLVALQGPEARDLLRDRITDPGEVAKVRAEAARLLGATGRGALAELESVLAGSSDAAIRAGAVRGLILCDEPKAAPRLREFLAAGDSRLRRAALSAISESSAPLAQVLAAESLARPGLDDASRIQLIEGAARAKNAGAASALLGMAADRTASPGSRSAAADALAAIGDPSAVESIRKLASDEVPVVAAHASAAEQRIRRLAGSRR